MRDWIAVHEFSHLHASVRARARTPGCPRAWPPTTRRSLRVRAGLLPEAEAWRRIYEGSRRAAARREPRATRAPQMFERRLFLDGVLGRRRVRAARRRRAARSARAAALARRRHARARPRAARANAQPMPAREVIARDGPIAGLPVFSELMQRWVLGPRPARPDRAVRAAGPAPAATACASPRAARTPGSATAIMARPRRAGRAAQAAAVAP